MAICHRELSSHYYLVLAFTQPEPFFLSFALYDLRRKLTETVYLDCNSDIVYQMIPSELVQGHDMLNSLQGQTSMPKLRVNNEKWLSKPGKVRDRNSNNDWSM